MKAEIEGGATLWARQTIESEIFLDKPDKWFKIWFYLVNRVSHKDTKRYKRGETFYHQEWICDATGASPDQVKKCLGWLRDTGMISTRRSTRGTWLEIPKYSHFQTLDNYYYDVKAPDEARQKHDRSTTEAPRYYKNDKNVKNDKNKINTCEPKDSRIPEVMKLFEEVNPSISKYYGNTTQRKACERLLKKWTIPQIKAVVDILPELNATPYAKGKSITPHQLEENLGFIKSFIDQKNTKKRKVAII
jgi:hypothetical protein